MTDQKAPDGPEERPEGGCAAPAVREGESGAQAGAQSLGDGWATRGPIGWARKQQRERAATRHVHVTIRNVDEYTANRQALSLVDWLNAEFDGLQVTTDAREWPAHDAGPTVREAAAQDREYWERKDAGETP